MTLYKFCLICCLALLDDMNFTPPSLKERGTQSRQKNLCSYSYNYYLGKKVYTYVDIPPEFPGGNIAMNRFILRHFTCMDSQSIDKINVSFIIDVNGSVRFVTIFNKNIDEYTLCEKEMVKVFNKMPLWKPGRCNGEIVPVQLSFGINF